MVIDFEPSERQYELWKYLQPNTCPHCGGSIENVFVGYDREGHPQYKPQCSKCGSQNLPQIILGVELPVAGSRLSAAFGS